MNFLKNTKGITLIEVLVAISLFGVVAMITVNIMINVSNIEKKGSVENAIYEDLRFVMQRLTDEIQGGAIDYEEYYNRYVLGDAIEENHYGVNYGVYGSRFYNPGKRSDGVKSKNPTDLGLECSYEEDGECQIIYSISTDLNTGQNPFFGDETKANAFCEKNKGLCNDEPIEELLLIDKTGTKKTIIGKKKINGSATQNDWALGIVEMEGLDIDQNGVIDTFRCLNKYNCHPAVASDIPIPYEKVLEGNPSKAQVISDNKITLPKIMDLKIPFDVNAVAGSDFVPISPMRSSIKDLRFIITPMEDPYKAYSETAEQMHPSVTIILTIGLSEQAALAYPGEFKDLTVQTTVTAGVLNRIDSYPPINDIGTGWIDLVLPDGFTTP